jgi:pSer/pThr/pTyr-binding forkhead associated (FHA) protein
MSRKPGTDSIHGEFLTSFIKTDDFKAPGRGGVRLFTISGPATGMNYRLEAGDTTLGRRTSNTIVLSGHGVSKRHCLFTLEDTGFCLVTDVGSRNGTFVNGKRLETDQRLQLAHGDKIRVCDTVFLLVQPEKPGRSDEEVAVDIDFARASNEASEFVDRIQDLVELGRKRRARKG